MPNTEESIASTGGIPEISMEVVVSGMTQTAVDKSLTIPDMAADAKAAGDAIRTALADIADLAADVASITLDFIGTLYPVGSIYVTTLDGMPETVASVGTWEEIAIPMTWGDLKAGTRSYAAAGESFTPGTIRFFLRTE